MIENETNLNYPFGSTVPNQRDLLVSLKSEYDSLLAHRILFVTGNVKCDLRLSRAHGLWMFVSDLNKETMILSDFWVSFGSQWKSRHR